MIKTYLDNHFSLKADLSELTNLVANEYLTAKYTNSVDLTTVYYNKIETGNMLNQKVNTSGNSSIQGRLDAYLFRCGEIRIKNDGDFNCLSMIQLTANESIIDWRTEATCANTCFKINGDSYIRLSTTDNISMYKDVNRYGVLATGNTIINGELITGNTTINGDSVITGRLDVGRNPAYSTNWINLHTDNTNGNSYKGVMQFSVWGGKNGTWDRTSNTTDVKLEIKLDGNLFMNFFNNNNEIRY